MKNRERHSPVNVMVNGKWRRQSRVIVENLLGRPLKREEIVHHINGNPQDDRPENLQLLSSQGEHRRLHAEIRRLNLRPKINIQERQPLFPGLQYRTIKYAAQMLRVSLIMAYRLARSGKLRAFKMGGGRSWRIREIDLKNFIEGKPSKKNKKEDK